MTPDTGSTTATSERAPDRAPAVLGTLILVAAVANLPMTTANVALPDIGQHFDASQTQLNLAAVGYSLGLAATVLWLGALGDRYGRKQMLLAGVVISLPACLLASWAPSIDALVAARVLGGVAAGMAYPTTLALITALWGGNGRTRAIALWSAVGGAVSALGPLLSGVFLEHWWWGSVFLLTLPLIVAAIPAIATLVPAHVNETTEPVDNIGGVLSVVMVTAVVVAINFVVLPDKRATALTCAAIGVVVVVAFVIRQRLAANPLYDLHVAARSLFWVAAVAGIIVFGALMGAMFIGQQYLQNVLGYSTIESGLAVLPAAVFMVVCAPRSAKLVEARGARFTLLLGYLFVVLSFVLMLVLWGEDSSYWQVGLAYALVGAGVGFAGTPASHSLTGAVPVTRAGMASGTADLQRDLGGAIMQSILGALLTAGYAAALAALIADSPQADHASSSVQAELTKSFSSAANTAEQYPQYADQIIEAARQSFVKGQNWAYTAGIVAVVVGALFVFLLFPRREREAELLASYVEEDARDEPTADG
jgi:DHA2 family multidrug resistance protein-like MFS transporter